jgi:hypothetical protein
MAYKLKILAGALDDVNGNIVLRGIIDPVTYSDIKIGEYQREEGTLSELSKLIAAIKAGSQLPDIEIGVRGMNYSERSGVFYVEHDCYVVDGQQRLTAARRVRLEDPTANIRLGALLHFGSNAAWECERFKILNLFRRKVSPNILLRNEKDHSSSVQAMVNMTASDKEFVLRDRVAWGQKMGRGELVTALTLFKTLGMLHSHFGPGLSVKVEEIVKSTDKTMDLIGPNIWRANARTFFATIEGTFGLTAIAFRDLSPQIKGGFLRALAKTFADHQNFWEDNRLKIDRIDLDKLRQFPLRDPGILSLVNGNSQVNAILYNRVVQHLNSGRKKNRMLKWNGQQADGMLDIPQDFQDSDSEESPEAS